MKSKGIIDCLDNFGEDTGLVVVWMGKRIGWTIEKCIFSARMAMKIEIHQYPFML